MTIRQGADGGRRGRWLYLAHPSNTLAALHFHKPLPGELWLHPLPSPLVFELVAPGNAMTAADRTEHLTTGLLPVTF